MAIQLSTGLRNAMLDTNSFRGGLNGGLLGIFKGTVPAAVDDATSGATLICTVSVDGLGGGLGFEAAAVAGVLSKAAAETWQGTVINSGGTATFYRFYESGGDPTAASTTEQRIQGSVGVAGADLNLSSVALVDAATQDIDFFNITLPAGG